MPTPLSVPASPGVRHPALRELSYWLHLWRRTWRGTVVISVANPLLFLTGIGMGLGQLVGDRADPALHGGSYLAFLTPGLLAAASMQNAFVDAAGPVYDSARPGGHYRAAAATPLRPADILHGHLLYILVRLVVSAFLFTAVATAFGAVAPARAPLVVPAAVLAGFAFAAPLTAWSVTLDRQAGLEALFRFVVMPLYMFSGAFFPLSQLPDAVEPLAYLSPLWHGVELCRSLALGTATAGGAALHTGVLAALTVAGVLLARRRYERRLHT
ncbi:ABC transporter permease [Streptomyces liangshanensis]|uniref:Transport permease protein n=1 Tax=Streptomyces liangshanensis TaxID=2717324 RepID=A0A6G9GVL6_9ACTN|nr:ABC transporter permease [Streptomyces liangshanensis]QIQ02265.1 ABC transporter permease [Streptomyces liangshanensis]